MNDVAAQAPTLSGLSVIVPALNENDAIGPQVKALREALDKVGCPWEVIVVDDGSTDGTGDTAAAAGATVLRNPTNGGYGAALKRGIVASRHEHIAICDADGTYPTERLPDLAREAARGFDMVVGARTGPHYRGSLFKHPSRLVYLELCRFVTGVKIPDANSGLRVFRKELALETFDELCAGFSFTTTLTIAAISRGAFVRFVPIDYHKRVGSSKVQIFRDSLRTAQLITQAILRYNPIKLFLLLSTAPLLATVACAALAFAFQSGSFVVAASVFAATTLIVFSFGLLADLMRPRDTNLAVHAHRPRSSNGA